MKVGRTEVGNSSNLPRDLLLRVVPQAREKVDDRIDRAFAGLVVPIS